jgi:hypothetical protein
MNVIGVISAFTAAGTSSSSSSSSTIFQMSIGAARR